MRGKRAITLAALAAAAAAFGFNLRRCAQEAPAPVATQQAHVAPTGSAQAQPEPATLSPAPLSPAVLADAPDLGGGSLAPTDAAPGVDIDGGPIPFARNGTDATPVASGDSEPQIDAEAGAPALEASDAEAAPIADPQTPAQAPQSAASDPAEEGAPPSFDVVRVARDGLVVVAGKAQPGERVEVLLDGETIAEAVADRAGNFAATAFDVFGSGEAANLTLVAYSATGAARPGAAPVVVVAAAEPKAKPIVALLAETPKILQSEAPAPKDDVSVDAISYGEDGAVTFSGGGEPGKSVRVYLGEALFAETRVSEGGRWAVSDVKEPVAEGVYVLRAELIGDDGAVLSRREFPFQRAGFDDIQLSDGKVVVQPGNNLWRIASKAYGSGYEYTVIYRANVDQIRDPDLIYPGQVFTVPGAE